MRKLILWSAYTFCLLVVALPVVAQKGKLRKAAAQLGTFQYEEAIRIYQKLHDKQPESVVPILGLAEAHRKLGHLTEAQTWYARALRFPNLDAEVYYHYGQLLFQRGDCESAQQTFQRFLQLKPYDERRTQLTDVCAYYEQLQTRGMQRTSLDHPDFNGPKSDLGPAFYGEGIVFGSVRPKPKEKVAFYDLYYTEPLLTSGTKLEKFTPISLFATSMDGGMHEAILSFSPDGNEVYFTRNQENIVSEKNPLHLLEIMTARKEATGEWSEVQPLPFNDKTYSTAHPALSPDGRWLFFSSDRPGGFGGKDIYMSERLGSTWSTPINLGPKVNTAGDELYPFFHMTEELYFASDGHLGLGGQDIFRAEYLGGGDWSRIENMGTPINSTADDFGLILNMKGNQGYFTSNREEGIGSDDIYAFQPRNVLLELQLSKGADLTIHTEVELTASGKSSPLYTDATGKLVRYLGHNECLFLTVTDNDFKSDTREICATESGLNDTLRINWELREKSTDAQLSNPQLLSEKRNLQIIVKDELTGKRLTDVKVDWNIQGQGKQNTEMVLYTNSTGELTNILSPGECVSLVFTKTAYFAEVLTFPICYEDISASPVEIYLAPYLLQEDQSLTDRESVENPQSRFTTGSQVYADDTGAIPYLLNIYYDLGRASVRTEAIPELHKLHQLLVENPGIVIEIGSHTDAQGSDEFNERLSQRRASAIARWLYDKGIPRDRIIARGYGETRPTNRCVDGVNCSEEEYQANRRTEFRVLEHNLGQTN